MPLARGNQVGGPVTVPPAAGGRVPPAIPTIGTYTPVWHAPDGTVLPLNPPGTDFFTLKSVGGLGAVPVDVVTTEAADGGVVVEFTRPKSRLISWPIRMRSDTHLGFVGLWHRVTDLFTQTRDLGPGRLWIGRPDGSAREILCHYQLGLEQDPNGDGAWTEMSASVGLLCPSPFWRDVNPTVREWKSEPQPDYLNPYPTISSGQVIGAATLRNDGVQDAWPTWTVRGPMTSLVATNVTRGESFTLTYSLTVGQTLTMSTKPIQVRGPAGQQAVNALNLLAGGIPWRVDARKITNITFTANGSAPETSLGANNGTMIRAEFTPKYETA